MNITQLIFYHWKIWMTVPVETNLWSLKGDKEGLGFYDGELMTFWYALNYNFYKMNNKKYAFTGCEEPFVEPRDLWDETLH